MQKSLDYVSDYELESACKLAYPRLGLTKSFFAVLVVRVHHVVFTPSSKLLSFLHLFLFLADFLPSSGEHISRSIATVFVSNDVVR